MRVLLTGHRGYIGSVMVPMLQEQGHDVVGLDTDWFERCTFTGTIPEVESIKKDTRDIKESDIEGFDAIIHLAGLSNDPMGDFRPMITEEINDAASVKLAEMAKKVGVKRFLFASSCSNYGASGDNFLTEEADFNPVTAYGRSKVQVELAVTKLADDNFCPTYLRASTAFGVSPRIRFDLVINNLTAWAVTTGRVFLKSDGTPWRPVVHVEDICRAYIAVLHAPIDLIHNESFNVGSTTENYQMSELADIVKDVVPGCRVDYADDAGPDTRCYRVDCNKIARVLHEFKPQWTARRGVEELYQQYTETGLTLEEFEGEKFMRIAHLQWLMKTGLLDENYRWIKQ
ncbi:MAG: NAD(P)-dependent oxidoreductase [Methylococcales bacterium]